MIKRIILSVITLLILSSCHKERTLHIKAVNPVTGAPCGGLHYVIVEEKSGMFEEKYKTVFEGDLDANGEAYPAVKIKKNRSYNIRCAEPPNTCYNKKISYTYAVQDQQNPTFLFEFAECAYLKLSINNVNCQGPSDNFKLYYMGRQVGDQGSNIVGALSLEGDGCFSYLGDSFSEVPMGEMYWKWEVTRNSITTTYYDTINLSAGEYRTYEINY